MVFIYLHSICGSDARLTAWDYGSQAKCFVDDAIQQWDILNAIIVFFRKSIAYTLKLFIDRLMLREIEQGTCHSRGGSVASGDDDKSRIFV